MARTKRAVSPSKRAVPIDVTALRERAKKLEARIQYTVPITIKIDARMYEALVESTEKYEVRFADMVRRTIAEGLAHLTEFVSPYEEPFAPAEYRPGRGLSRTRNALEQITGQPVVREQMVDNNDPLVAATLGMGVRAGMPRRVGGQRAPSTVAHSIASALDDDEAETTETIEAEA